MPIDLQPDQFENDVVGSSVPVLVDFWGPQCIPCIALNPTVADLEQMYSGGLKVVKVNTPDHRKLCIQLKVLGLPTFIMFRDGVEIARISKNQISSNELTKWVVATLPQ